MTRRPRRRLLLRLLLALALTAGVWGYKLVVLQQSVQVSARHWQEPQGVPGGLRYVALGDSVAQGIGASHPDKGYVGLLADRLRRATGRPVEVINLSSSGARIEDLLRDQLPRLRNLEPDVVTVAIGGNDVRSYDRAAFVAAVERLTAALPAGSYVADAPYFMHGRWQRDADGAAAALRRSVAERGLTAVPLHQTLQDRGWAAMGTDFAADWFHPNDRGHRVWADAFWSAMRSDPSLGQPAGPRRRS